MRHFLWCVLACGLPLNGIEAATVYRSVDDQGNIVFTDSPRENSQRITLQPLTVVPSQEAASPEILKVSPKGASGKGVFSSSATDPFIPYSIFGILSPEDGYTLQTGYAGDLIVDIEIEPALRKDHRIRLLVDGDISQSAMHAQTFILNNLNRGEHTLVAELLDAQDQVRHRSDPVTLYVHRASVNLPSNPNNPA